MRIGFTIFVLALTLALPYWIYLPAIFLGIIFFPLYIEAIFIGLFIDVIYSSADMMLFGFPFGIIAAVLVLFAQPVREHLRFNA